VRGTYRASSPAEGVVDRGAFAGRDDHARGKGRRGCQRLLMPEWEKRGEEMGRGDVGGFRVSVSMGQEKK
jgi:hypothetical protein